MSEIDTIEAADYAALAAKQIRKYKNERVEIDGRWFDSKAEARRYGELMLMRQAGEIDLLGCQVKFPLAVNGVKICTYIADFMYWRGDEMIVEDVKGVRTPAYKIKRKLMKAVYGIDVKEIEA